MKEFQFRVITIEVGWVPIQARDEEEAKLKLKATYSDASDMLDDRKAVEGNITDISLQNYDAPGYESVSHLYDMPQASVIIV